MSSKEWISREKAAIIKAQYGRYNAQQVARIYGVGESTVYRIWSGNSLPLSVSRTLHSIENENIKAMLLCATGNDALDPNEDKERRQAVAYIVSVVEDNDPVEVARWLEQRFSVLDPAS